MIYRERDEGGIPQGREEAKAGLFRAKVLGSNQRLAANSYDVASYAA